MDKKILLVTGGSRGIGAATARLAARQGYDVAINYVGNEKAARKVVADIEKNNARGIAIKGDMASEADIKKMFEAVDKLGKLTHVVNNAGIIGTSSKFADADADMMRRVVDVNVTGAMIVAREAVRRMSTARGGKGGAIVNLGSMASFLGAPGEFVWYAASKGAVDTLTIGLSKEVAGEGIRVNAVAPGLIDTDIHASAGQPDRVARMRAAIPMGRPGAAEEVADAILYLLSEQASYVTGTIVRISGGR
ncbi:MAG: SDR family oxidoreductase [Xanthobacteraceae bacterium]|nr:SDR family oxidoreductase [Xanthobacteraceae bacterium]